jgi:2-oxoglutarate ferredoxin oxidoreductase subunit alpha
MKNFDVVTFQAEDEIAAMGAAIGASFAGSLGCTGTSGPGLALKSEAIGLAVMTELPVVIVDVQRGGPSTGLPTKTEQADLLQGMFGRNGECPVPVLAASSPADCFNITIEAFHIATRYMTPVLVLTDGYLANGSEPWKLPDFESMPKIQINHPSVPNDPKGFLPYLRNSEKARPWAVPGTAGLEHRLGGIEKQDITGNVSYDPANHEHMVQTRAAKVAGIQPQGDDMILTGEDHGKVLVVGWGGTFGSIKAAVLELQDQGIAVSSCHIRYINPLPKDLGKLLRNFEHVLVPELNAGQLLMLLRAQYLVDARPLTKVRGQPFTISEIKRGIRQILDGQTPQLSSARADVAVPAGG